MKMKLRLLVFGTACLTAGILKAADTPLWQAGISLIPYPQEAALAGEAFVVDGPISIRLDDDASESARFAARDLAERITSEWGVPAQVGSGSGKTIFLSRKGAPERVGEQGYTLVVGAREIRIAAGGEAGLFYATRTILQLPVRDAGGLRIPGLILSDWPDIKYRAAHYDTKHHQDKSEYVRSFIRDLADYKINMLVWEWEDKFAYPSHPEIGAPGAFTMAEMQEFTRYARQFHIQIVPLVQGLGHVSFILKWPQFQHLREIPASNWEFCPLKDGSYDLLFDLWKDAIEATPGSEFMHIGTDETYELGQGTECGCRARAAEVGRRGLLLDFVNRSAAFVQGKMGRRMMTWGGEYIPNAPMEPAKGVIYCEFTDDLEQARISRDAGYPAWVYDPNPGIEHLFLPYIYTERRNRQTDGCLLNSYRQVAPAARSGFYEGMINTSWDDSGLHNQVWMMSWVNSAEYSWSGADPAPEEFFHKYFVSYYGSRARDLEELWKILNDGAYFYMDTFERKVWHWGEIGKTQLPDLPRGDAVEYDPFWNTRYKEMVGRSVSIPEVTRRGRLICRLNRSAGVKHAYDFEVFETMLDLVEHTAGTYTALSRLEQAIGRAHRARFVGHQETLDALDDARRIVEENLADRSRMFENLVSVWEQTRFPKGMSLPEKTFFWQQDRARHFAFRRPDMSYLIWDEQLLDLEGYLGKLRDYIGWYRTNFAAELRASADR